MILKDLTPEVTSKYDIERPDPRGDPRGVCRGSFDPRGFIGIKSPEGSNITRFC